MGIVSANEENSNNIDLQSNSVTIDNVNAKNSVESNLADSEIQKENMTNSISLNNENIMKNAVAGSGETRAIYGNWADAKNAIYSAKYGDTIYLNGTTYKATNASDTIQIFHNTMKNIDGNYIKIIICGGSKDNPSLVSTLDMNKLGRILTIGINFVTIDIINVNFLNGMRKSSSPLDVDANAGGAIFCNGRKVKINIINCSFENNEAGKYGGAIYGGYKVEQDRNQYGSNVNLTITNCNFKNNEVNNAYGAAIFGGNNVNIINCSFNGNHAGSGYGAIFGGGIASVNPSGINPVEFSENNVNITNCNFEGNTGCFAGAIILQDKSKLTVSNSTFRNNYGSWESDAIYGKKNNLVTISNSTFIEHKSDGNVIYMDAGSLNISNSEFKNNSNMGGTYPGTIYLVNCNFTVFNSTFTDNKGAWGGAIHMECKDSGFGSLNVSNSEFICNNANGRGEAIYAKDNILVYIEGSKFMQNETNSGSILCFDKNSKPVTVSNCEFITADKKLNEGVIRINGVNCSIFNSKFNITSNTNNNAYIIGVIGRSILNLSNNTCSRDIPILVSSTTDIVSKTQLTGDNITTTNNPTKIDLKLVDDNNNLIVVNKYDNFNNIDGRINVTIENTDIEMEFQNSNKSYSGMYTPDFVGVRLVNSTVFSNLRSSVYIIVKKDSVMNITTYVDNFNVTINVTLEDVNGSLINGKVNITVNNETHEVNITNGTGKTIFNNLKPDNYTVKGEFSGNDEFGGANCTAEFEIVKQNATVSVSVDNGTYGDPVKVNVTLIGVNGAGLNGNVTIIINGTQVNKTVADGKGSFDYDVILPAGEHNVTVKFEGDELYNEVENSTTFNIAKLNTTVSVVVNNMTCMDNITGTITLNAANGVKLNGTVKVKINGTQYPSITVVNGSGTINLTNNLISGEYNVTVTYEENENYTASSANATFIVEKITTNIACNISVNGFNATIMVITNANGTVNIAVDGTSYNRTIVNGSAVLNLTDLAVGNYTVVVTYPGNEYYNGTKVNDTFSVGKLASVMNIAAVPGIFNATINVTLNTDGNVTIAIDGRNFPVEVKGGVGSVVVSDLKPANYTIDAVFEGNDRYDGTTANGSVIIAKQNATVSVSVDNGTYGDHVKVNVTLIGANDIPLNGTVTIIINGTEHNESVADGKGSFDYDVILPAGDYNVTVKFGDELYNATENSTTFNIAKANTTVSVVVNNMTCMENITGTITLNATNGVKLNGTVNITINSTSYNITVVNGSGTINLTNNLISGEYNVTVTYEENENYTASSANATFIVEKITTTITCNINVNGSNATIKVTTNANGTVNITVDGTEHVMPINNGTAELPLTNLTDGKHNVIVTYPGNEYYNETNKNYTFSVGTFNVGKLDSVMNIAAVPGVFNATITVTLNTDGKVKITIDNRNFPVEVKGGVGSVVVSDLKPGNYTIVGVFDGNDRYDGTTATGYVIVKPVPVVDVKVNTTGSNVTIKVTTDANGTVNITVDGTEYVVPINNGTAELTLTNLTDGKHNVTVTYPGNEYYNETNKNYTFSVDKLASDMAIKAVPGVFNATITVTLNTDGKVKITIDNRNFTVEIKNGVGSVVVSDLKPGNYTIVGVFDGNDRYDGTTATGYVIVKSVPVVDVKVNTTGSNVTIKVTTDANGTVNITVDGIEYVVPINNGTAELTLTNLTGGNHTIVVSYPGIDNFNEFTTSEVFEIESKSLIITAEPVIEFFGDNETLVIKATDDVGNPVAGIFVEFEINGIKYNRTTDSKGLAVKPIDLPVGFYKFDVCFKGNSDYAPITVSSNITVKTTIIGQDIVKIFRNGTQFSATFLDSEGNLLKNSSVSFNISGISYYRLTDVSGSASLNINLAPGTYVLSALNSANGELRLFNVTVLPNMIAHDVVKYFRNGTQYEIKLLDEHGNAAPIGTKVAFNINGVFYEKTVKDASGIAVLDINLLPDNYILTAIYNGLSMSNNVTVLSTIQSEDLNISTNDRKPFVVTLLDDHGLPAKGVEATFNIHGVFYHEVSDANGMVKLDINLQAGEYIITTYYKDLAKSNNIIVREETEVESII